MASCAPGPCPSNPWARVQEGRRCGRRPRSVWTTSTASARRTRVLGVRRTGEDVMNPPWHASGRRARDFPRHVRDRREWAVRLRLAADGGGDALRRGRVAVERRAVRPPFVVDDEAGFDEVETFEHLED